MKEVITKIIKGIIIGIAALTAGAGTFAIVLGIYDRCMAIIANPFKNFKENLKYIWPILVGILIGAACCAKLVIFLLDEYTAFTRCAFLGIIIGGIPTLIKVANKEGFKKKYLISTLIAFILTIICTMMANNTKAGTEVRYLSIVELIIYGAIYAWGAVMPGMTTMHILIYMGVLGPILSGFTALDLSIIIPFGIGYIALALTTAGMITWLFKKFYGITYYAIIGFSITSLIMFIPEFTSISQVIIGIIIVIIFTIFMYGVTVLDKKVDETKEKEGVINEG
ncbi:MAG: undecaprenyl phosphate translocase family protein [Clostridia bacterium]